jgi:hypothetical protein
MQTLCGVAFIAYSVYLRSLWRQLKEHGSKNPVGRSEFPRFAVGAQALTDAKVDFFGPLWPGSLLAGILLLALHDPSLALILLLILGVLARLAWMVFQQ